MITVAIVGVREIDHNPTRLQSVFASGCATMPRPPAPCRRRRPSCSRDRPLWNRGAPKPMNVHEYQAAEILSRHGIPVNAGEIATTPDGAAGIAGRFGGLVAIKAQVHSGGRGKAGGIKLARSADDARAAAEQILGMDTRGHIVNTVLVVPGI